MKEPNWLSETGVRAIHSALIAQHGGAEGVRDANLLDSALARPRNALAYAEPTLFDLAAAYAYGIARNHPFVDGNKRTALMAAYVFLRRNGYRLIAPEPEAVVIMRELASGEIDEAELAAWIAANVERLSAD